MATSRDRAGHMNTDGGITYTHVRCLKKAAKLSGLANSANGEVWRCDPHSGFGSISVKFSDNLSDALATEISILQRLEGHKNVIAMLGCVVLLVLVWCGETCFDLF
jgi:hypothetical protein